MWLPEGLTERIVGILGDSGERWIADVSGRCAQAAEEWDLVEIGRPFPGGSTSIVVPVVNAEGMALVLKLAPRPEWLEAEYRALVYWDGAGAVAAKAWSPRLGALLIEAVEPGITLKEADVSEEEEWTAFVQVAARLQGAESEPPGGLPGLSSWLTALERSSPNEELRVAQGRAREVRASLREGGRQVVLHGDLHHDNLLRSSSGEWVAVDPKGIVGPREVEPAAFLRNPRGRLLSLPDDECVGRLKRRCDAIASALQLDRGEVAGWAFVMGVVAAAWADEDQGSDEAGSWLRCARMLEEVHRRVAGRP